MGPCCPALSVMQFFSWKGPCINQHQVRMIQEGDLQKKVWAGCSEDPNNSTITSANKTELLPFQDPEGQGGEVVTGTWENHVMRGSPL